MRQQSVRCAITIAIIAGALLGFAFAEDPAPAAKPKPLNVLFIISDDLRTECSYYGGLAKTPNIYKLAAAGIRFDRAYRQFPLCNLSRSSLLTGRYPTTTGILGNRGFFGDAHPDFVSLPKW
jgi:iduronate 2-sulfatase